MNRATFFPRAPLGELLLRTATIIFLSAAATAHAATDGLAILNTPPTRATVGQAYSFTPTVANPAKRVLHFSVWNKATWLNFNSSTGQLTGTPPAIMAGTVSDPGIVVTDGVSKAYLATPGGIVVLHVYAATGTADKPVISGTPPASATAGSTYRFQPTAKDPAGKALSFSVRNKPSWASFSISSGLLDGTPTTSQDGTYGNIIISASNGQYSSALPAFSVTVKPATGGTTGAATINWVPPTKNTNGSAVTNLAGIRIYYGTSMANLNHMMQVAGATTKSTTIGNLTAGTWYFGGVSYTTSGVQSAMSTIVSKYVP